MLVDALYTPEAAALIAGAALKAAVYSSRIVTRVDPLRGFYAAEDYHQDYATLHPESGYIRSFDLPKIANLKKLFPQWYRDAPVLVSAAASAKR